MALYARSLSEQESREVQAGLRSSDGVWSRHCQILRASSQGVRVQVIARALGWHDESVRHVIRRFNRDGLDAVRSRKPPGPKALEDTLSEEALSALWELARQSPQVLGLIRPIWTSDLLAQAAWERGILPERVSGQRLTRMMARQGYTWKQVKGWLISPDPHYAEKNSDASDSSPASNRGTM